MRPLTLVRRVTILSGCTLALAASFTVASDAQTASSAPILARQAIENRKAVFTLIGSNFKPIGEVLKGSAPPGSLDIGKYASRVSFLAGFVAEYFPDVSKSGDTEARPEIWSNHADFDKRLKEFTEHALALSLVVSHGDSNNDAFKAAARSVAQDCKGCHDNYRAK